MKRGQTFRNFAARITAAAMTVFVGVGTVFTGGTAVFAEDTSCSSAEAQALLEAYEGAEEVLAAAQAEYQSAGEALEEAQTAYDNACETYTEAKDAFDAAEAALDVAETAYYEAADALEAANSRYEDELESASENIVNIEETIEDQRESAEALAEEANELLAAYEEAAAAVSEAEAAVSEAEAAADAAKTALLEAIEAAKAEQEDLITDYENENNSLYGLINWMLDGYEEYTGETLSDDQITELTLAQSNLSAIMSGDSEWFNSSYSYSSDDIDPTSSTDALALTNVLKSLSIIDSINEMRATDDNYVGYEDCLTNFVMMVGSAYTADVSIYQVAHVSMYGQFAYNENLAWGYSNPVSGWYTSEKQLFDACRDELGYDVSDGEGLTSSEIGAVMNLASSYGYTIGHYTNLMYSSTQLVGVGYTTTRYLYSTTSSSNAAPLSRYTASYTTDEMRAFITAYQEYLEDYEDSRITAAENLVKILEEIYSGVEAADSIAEIISITDGIEDRISELSDPIDETSAAFSAYEAAMEELEYLEAEEAEAAEAYSEAVEAYESVLDIIEELEEELAEWQETYDTLLEESAAAKEEANAAYDEAYEEYALAEEALSEAETACYAAVEACDAAWEALYAAKEAFYAAEEAYETAYSLYEDAYEAYSDYMESADHSYVAAVTDPTCTEQGYTTYICSVCGYTYITDYVEATGHTAGDAVAEGATEATCTEGGSYDSVVYCTACGTELSRETITTEATGHVYAESWTWADDSLSALKSATCTVCGEVDTEKAITAIWGSTRYTTANSVAGEAFQDGCTYAVIADGQKFPDALAAASLAGAVDGPVIVTNDNNVTSTIEELKALGVTKVYIVGGTSSVSTAVEEAIEAAGITVVKRLAGSSRVETALEVAEEVLELTADSSSDTCIISTSGNYPDVLCASAYSYWASAPIYFTNTSGTSLSAATLEAIRNGNYSNVIIVGGTSSVSEDVEEAIKALGVNVTRLGGADRYATAVLIAEWSVEQGMSYDNAAVATGTNFPDALVASALCGQNGSVLLLSNPTVSKNTALSDVISENADEIFNIYIVGGESSVSADVRKLIADALD